MNGDGRPPSGEDERMWPALLVTALVLLLLAGVLVSALYA
mgnify:FL=1